MNLLLREHERATQQTAKVLEQEGYTVIPSPSPDKIPFPLGGYVPDLLASKGDAHLVIEVKTRGQSPATLQTYREVAEIIGRHPNWRFLVKTVTDPEVTPEGGDAPLSGLPEIKTYLAKAERVINAGAKEMAVPYIWNAIVQLLRWRANHYNLQCAGLSDRSIINQLYTVGIVSSDDYDQLVSWNNVRNQAVHDVRFEVGTDLIAAMMVFAKTLAGDIESEIEHSKNSPMAESE